MQFMNIKIADIPDERLKKVGLEYEKELGESQSFENAFPWCSPNCQCRHEFRARMGQLCGLVMAHLAGGLMGMMDKDHVESCVGKALTEMRNMREELKSLQQLDELAKDVPVNVSDIGRA